MSSPTEARSGLLETGDLAGGPCASHPQSPAQFFCDGCGALLCRECARDIGSIQTCRHCGERAVALRQPPAASRSHVHWDRPAAGDAGFLGWLSHHLVVPLAITAMVAALLFYLLDVRSVFLGGGSALKQIGLCFAAATVLIARYGKLGGDSERQGCYSLALLGATSLVMVVAPWSPTQGGGWELLANLAILLAVWRFAGRLTRRMSIEGEAPPVSEKRLYGVERLRMEAWARSQEPVPVATPKQRLPGRFARQRKARVDERDAHGNPAAGVARLALVALAVFALGEPLLLSAPPEIGERALAAVIVFLLATAVVLAAGSGLGLSRQVRRGGGSPAAGLVPSRIACAALLTVIMLAAVLAIPGVTYRGSGVAPVEAGDGDPLTVGKGRPDGAGQARSGPSPRESGGEGSTGDSQQSRGNTGGDGPSSALISQLAALGQWLKWPILILVAVLGAFGLARLFSRLGSGAGLRAWLAGLLGRFRRRKATASRPKLDPLADLDTLAGLPPRKAVIDAYGRFLGVVDQLGYSRRMRDTPYEVLTTVNKRFRVLTEPARQLTALYVRAAYSEQALTEKDRQEAVVALGELGRQVANRPSVPSGR